MLKPGQLKSVREGVSFSALGSVLLAGVVIFVWGRSIVNTFDRPGDVSEAFGMVTPTIASGLLPESTRMSGFAWSGAFEAGPTATVTASPTMGSVYSLSGEESAVVVPAWTVTPIPTVSEALVYPDVIGMDDNGLVGWVDVDLIASYYWPPLGGINCDSDCSTMANGESWKPYIGKSLACPVEFPFGTLFKVSGRVWVCKDRGGMILERDGAYWVDFLYPQMPYGGMFYGQVIQGAYLLP